MAISNRRQLFFKAMLLPSLCGLGLFISLVSAAQIPAVAAFEDVSGANYSQEKVFLHVDKTAYATGEIIWFKAYVTNAATNFFSGISTVCYVEILNKDNKPVIQEKINIDSGKGSGSILLPASLRTATYSIRAYTSLMKNEEPASFYTQDILVVNPDKKPAELKITPDSGYYNFFPEGGNLVYGLQNYVAFKASNKYGEAQAATVYIISGKDTAASFKTGLHGTATFLFTARDKGQYYASVHSDGRIIKKELPEIYSQGWVLHVHKDKGMVSIQVVSNVPAEKNISLYIHNQLGRSFQVLLPLLNGKAEATISDTAFAEGVSELTILNTRQQPVCERLYFKKPTHILEIISKPLPNEVATRSQVNVQLATTDSRDSLVNADLSVSVYLADSLENHSHNNILNYLWLTSALQGKVDNADDYFTKNDLATDTATEELLLTQGWRRYLWQNIDHEPAAIAAPVAEHEGQAITGKIISKTSGLPAAGIPVFLSAPAPGFRFSSTVSSADGTIQFNVPKFYGAQEIIVQVNAADSNYRVLIDNPFTDKYADATNFQYAMQPSMAGAVVLRSISAQAQKNYAPVQYQHFTYPVRYDTTAFFGLPDKTYMLDDYTRFPTMEEVMREYVKEVRVKKRDKLFSFNVLNLPTLTFFEESPLILLDGLRIPDANSIINIDPLKIKKIEILATTFYAGQNYYKGIVSYSTYGGDLNGYDIGRNSLLVDYNGLQYEREFYSPQYPTQKEKDSRLPDRRNVLYWSSKLQTINGTGGFSFYTSDVPGKYIVLVQGLTKTGLAGFATMSFSVNPSPVKN